VIVFGLGRFGERLAFGLKEAELQVLGVDFDPEVAQGMRGKGLAISYGDGTDANFLEGLPLAGAAWVVSTLPDLASNLDLLQALREHHCGAEVAIVAREEKDGLALKRAGAPDRHLPHAQRGGLHSGSADGNYPAEVEPRVRSLSRTLIRADRSAMR
jgi:Trk K+ transport system NAD-binding subunit